MKTMELGASGLTASVVALGAWGIGGGNTWSDTNTDVKGVASLLDAATDSGINLIDTAPVYGVGQSEGLLGKALKGRRDRFLLQTKCGLNWRDQEGRLEYVRDGRRVYRNLSAASIRQDLEDSLIRMGLDYIDIYITHRQSDTVSIEETMGALQEMIREGKIRAAGISQANPEILQEYLRTGPVALVQEKFGVLAPENGKEYIPACEKAGTAFQVYSSLESGALAGPEMIGREFPEGDVRRNSRWFAKEMQPHMKALYDGWKPLAEKYQCSYANLAQAWTLAQSASLNLLIGVRRIESLLDTVKSIDIRLSGEDMETMGEDCGRLLAL